LRKQQLDQIGLRKRCAPLEILTALTRVDLPPPPVGGDKAFGKRHPARAFTAENRLRPPALTFVR